MIIILVSHLPIDLHDFLFSRTTVGGFRYLVGHDTALRRRLVPDQYFQIDYSTQRPPHFAIS